MTIYKSYPSKILLVVFCIFAITLSTVFIQMNVVNAQQKNNTPKLAKGVKTLVMPDKYKLNILIRTTLVAFSQANQTGNYSVLRDLSSPQFQWVNSNARLVELFANIRKRKLNLLPIIFYTPKLYRPAKIQNDGILRVTGFFETKPEQVLFDLGFQYVAKEWRLAALNIEVRPPQQKLLEVVPPNAKKKSRKATNKIIQRKKRSKQ